MLGKWSYCHLWNLGIATMFVACLAFSGINEVMNLSNEVLATKAKTIRTSTNTLATGRDRLDHPLQSEWHVFVPKEPGFRLALQFENIDASIMDETMHAPRTVPIASGRHAIRFNRDQLDDNQRLRVSIDGRDVMDLRMDDDWQDGHFVQDRHEILRSSSFRRNSPASHMNLEAFTFWGVGKPNASRAKGVWLAIASDDLLSKSSNEGKEGR